MIDCREWAVQELRKFLETERRSLSQRTRRMFDRNRIPDMMKKFVHHDERYIEGIQACLKHLEELED